MDTSQEFSDDESEIRDFEELSIASGSVYKPSDVDSDSTDFQSSPVKKDPKPKPKRAYNTEKCENLVSVIVAANQSSRLGASTWNAVHADKGI